jgi:hypothetical protein
MDKISHIPYYEDFNPRVNYTNNVSMNRNVELLYGSEQKKMPNNILQLVVNG